MKRYISSALAALALLAGCNRGLESKEAVRQAVIDYLATRANMNVASMQVDVVSVAFRQNEAEATVNFRPKGAEGGTGMTMTYKLERLGNRWVVKARSTAGGTQHGGTLGSGMELPAGHPPVGTPQKSDTPK